MHCRAWNEEREEKKAGKGRERNLVQFDPHCVRDHKVDHGGHESPEFGVGDGH